MGKRKSKTSKQKQAKAKAATASKSKAKANARSNRKSSSGKALSAFGGVALSSGSKGKGQRDRASAALLEGGAGRRRKKEFARNHFPLTDGTMKEHWSETATSKPNPLRGCCGPHAGRSDDEQCEFRRELRSMEERYAGTNGAKQSGSRSATDVPGGSLLFDTLAPATLQINPPTAAELVDEATERVRAFTAMGSRNEALGMDSVTRQEVQDRQPGTSNLLQVMAARRRADRMLEKHELRKNPPKSSNPFAILDEESDDEGDSRGPDSMPLFQLAPASFAFQAAVESRGENNEDDDPDL